MKNWKKCVLIIVVIFLIGSGYFILQPNNVNTEKIYKLGKTPHSYQYTFGKNILLYKDNVVKNEESKFSGLYYKKLNKDNANSDKLLTDSYYGCANIYGNNIIFIDEKFNIVKNNLKTGEEETLVKCNQYSIQDALVIEDTLYYIQETEEDVFSLYTLNLKDKQKKILVKNINPHYLYYYMGNVGVISKKKNKLVICNMIDGIVKKYENQKYEIQGFLEDGTVVYYEDGKVCAKQSLESDKIEILYENNNIYRIILQPEEMLICTLDEYGLLEVYIYNFMKKEINKIANANTVPRDFNEDYIVCASEEEGIGGIELIERKSGRISMIERKKKVENIPEITKDTTKGNIEEKDIQKTNYKEQISEKEMELIETLLKKYYEEEMPYDLVNYHVADNSHFAYQYHQEYSPGNILVYEVQTDHEAGGDVQRHIIFARKDLEADWKCIGEGY